VISLKIESDYFEVQIPSTINNRMVCTYLNSLTPRSDWNVEYNNIESDVSNDVNVNSLIDDGNDTHPIQYWEDSHLSITSDENQLDSLVNSFDLHADQHHYDVHTFNNSVYPGLTSIREHNVVLMMNGWVQETKSAHYSSYLFRDCWATLGSVDLQSTNLTVRTVTQTMTNVV
jgi:hypothetical protein